MVTRTSTMPFFFCLHQPRRSKIIFVVIISCFYLFYTTF